ncbi:MAG: CpaF family protein [Alphaproteobacteria bacterium]|nr:CpaF family protein [Alphaproteobacteria bacterium]
MKRFGRRDEEGTQRAPGVERVVPPPVATQVPPTAVVTAARVADLRSRVLRQIDAAAAVDLPTAVLQRQLEQLVHDIATELRYELTAREQARLAEELANDMIGYGPLEQLLRDDSVSDIMVNAPNNVYVERRGRLELTDVRFRDNEHISTIAQKIAARVGRRIDESSPMVDARLKDGSRVNVIFPPLAVDAPCISIRKFSRHRLDFAGLVRNGSMTTAVAELLRIASHCRLNMLISGGTGSGKTTLLNAMSQAIDHGERIVTVEDAAELQLVQPHVIRLETRPPNLEGTGMIAQRDLLRNALRMRPDRIIVGEVRGAEAFDMLQAMNTGHDGSISTLHANTAYDAITRIENMVQMGQFNLPVRAIRSQILSAVDLIVQVERMRDGIRRVTQVSEIGRLDGDVVELHDILTFNFERMDEDGRIVGQYVASPKPASFIKRLSYFGLDGAWTTAIGGV